MEKIFLNKRLVVIAFFTVFSTSTALAAGSGEGYDEVPVEMKLKSPLMVVRFPPRVSLDVCEGQFHVKL